MEDLDPDSREASLLSRYVDLWNEGKEPSGRTFIPAHDPAAEELSALLEVTSLTARVLSVPEGAVKPVEHLEEVWRRLRPRPFPWARVASVVAATLLLLAAGLHLLGGRGEREGREAGRAGAMESDAIGDAEEMMPPTEPGRISSDPAGIGEDSGEIDAAVAEGGDGDGSAAPGWEPSAGEEDWAKIWRLTRARRGVGQTKDRPAPGASPSVAARYKASPFPLARMNVEEVIANPAYNADGRRLAEDERNAIDWWLYEFRELAANATRETIGLARPILLEKAARGEVEPIVPGSFVQAADLNGPETARSQIRGIYVGAARQGLVTVSRKEAPEVFRIIEKMEKEEGFLAARIRERIRERGVLGGREPPAAVEEPREDAAPTPPEGSAEEPVGPDEYWRDTRVAPAAMAYRLSSMNVAYAISANGYNPSGLLVTPHQRAEVERVMRWFRSETKKAGQQMSDLADPMSDAAWESGDFEPLTFDEYNAIQCGKADPRRLGGPDTVREEMRIHRGGKRGGEESHGIITILRSDHPEVFAPFAELDRLHALAEKTVRGIIEGRDVGRPAPSDRTGAPEALEFGFSIRPPPRKIPAGDEVLCVFDVAGGEKVPIAYYVGGRSKCNLRRFVETASYSRGRGWRSGGRTISERFKAGSDGWTASSTIVEPHESVTFRFDFEHDGCDHEPITLAIDLFHTTVPVITYFTPPEGKEGDRVTIYGGPFSAAADENDVRFSNVRARVVEAEGHRLVVEVPFGARLGPLTVQVSGERSDGSTIFIVRN